MSCDVGKATKGWGMSCDVGAVTERLEIYSRAHSPTFSSLHLCHSSFSNPSVALILQPFRPFTYLTAHSPTLPSLYLRHSWFSNPSVASPTSQLILPSSFWFSKHSVTSPTSQLILQPFPRFTYVTTHSPTLPLLHLRHSLFSNPSFASPTSQDFHLRHLASRPWSRWLHQHSRYQWNFSFFRTDLSTHLAPFHRLQTCLGFLLFLPNSILQRRRTWTTFSTFQITVE